MFKIKSRSILSFVRKLNGKNKEGEKKNMVDIWNRNKLFARMNSDVFILLLMNVVTVRKSNFNISYWQFSLPPGAEKRINSL